MASMRKIDSTEILNFARSVSKLDELKNQLKEAEKAINDNFVAAARQATEDEYLTASELGEALGGATYQKIIAIMGNNWSHVSCRGQRRTKRYVEVNEIGVPVNDKIHVFHYDVNGYKVR